MADSTKRISYAKQWRENNARQKKAAAIGRKREDKARRAAAAAIRAVSSNTVKVRNRGRK